MSLAWFRADTKRHFITSFKWRSVIPLLVALFITACCMRHFVVLIQEFRSSSVRDLVTPPTSVLYFPNFISVATSVHWADWVQSFQVLALLKSTWVQFQTCMGSMTNIQFTCQHGSKLLKIWEGTHVRPKRTRYWWRHKSWRGGSYVDF